MPTSGWNRNKCLIVDGSFRLTDTNLSDFVTDECFHVKRSQKTAPQSKKERLNQIFFNAKFVLNWPVPIHTQSFRIPISLT